MFGNLPGMFIAAKLSAERSSVVVTIQFFSKKTSFKRLHTFETVVGRARTLRCSRRVGGVGALPT